MSSSIVVNPRKLGLRGWIQVGRMLTRARRQGGAVEVDPEVVFIVIRPFHGPELDAIYERCMADPDARRVLEHDESLHPLLGDLPRLRALADGTVGREYARLMGDDGLDMVAFAEASWRHMERADYAHEGAWRLANRLRDAHELVHVLSGYGTDVLGEMAELAFNVQEDPRPKGSAFAIRANSQVFDRIGARHARPVIRDAYARGRGIGIVACADWNELVTWPVDEVRAKLGISPPPSYTPIAKGREPGRWSPPGPRDLVGAWLDRSFGD